MKAEKKRLDVLVQENGLAESRSLAQKLIMAGKVRVNDNMVIKPSTLCSADDRISLDAGPRFVSRGGEKLSGALEAFGADLPNGKICADVGASTGGFTDCLLQYGAKKVYAIDVGYGILHWKIRNDPRVVSMEKTNARDLKSLPEPVELVTVDASFISLQILLPVIRNWFGDSGGTVISLIKPQFEAGKKEAAKGAGVIRDPEIHKKVLMETLGKAEEMGYGIYGLIRSPLKGPKGNTEFLVWLQTVPNEFNIEEAVQNTVENS